MSRPIVEFGGTKGFFLLVDSRPFLEAAILGTAFLASNRATMKAELTSGALSLDRDDAAAENAEPPAALLVPPRVKAPAARAPAGSARLDSVNRAPWPSRDRRKRWEVIAVAAPPGNESSRTLSPGFLTTGEEVVIYKFTLVTEFAQNR